MTSTFTKHWDEKNGYTQQEAFAKKAKVDEAHGVGRPESKWNSAEVVLDPNKQSGYMVVIRTK